MSDFDPYLKWLGIRKTAQSIDHYRLLGLELFEDDSEVIAMAADRQMTHIRTYQNGPNGEASQQILNELARARRCLLNAEKKAQYDAQLRQELQSPDTPESIPRSGLAPPPVIPSVTPEIVTPEIVSAEVVAAEVVAAEVGIRVDADARSKTKKRERKQLAWSLFGWLSGAVAAVGVSAFLIGSGWLPNLNVAENEQVNPPELVFGDVEPSETLAPGDKTPRAITESSSPPTRTSQPDLVSAMPSGSAREAEPPKLNRRKLNRRVLVFQRVVWGLCHHPKLSLAKMFLTLRISVVIQGPIPVRYGCLGILAVKYLTEKRFDLNQSQSIPKVKSFQTFRKLANC